MAVSTVVQIDISAQHPTKINGLRAKPSARPFYAEGSVSAVERCTDDAPHSEKRRNDDSELSIRTVEWTFTQVQTELEEV